MAIIGPDFIVDTSTFLAQYNPAVTVLSDGRFVITWHSTDFTAPAGDGDGDSVRARIFNADGSPAGDDFLVNTTADGNQRDPAITALAGGKFVVTWASWGENDGFFVRARVYNADGSPAGDDFLVGAGGDDGRSPAVTPQAGGTQFLITWEQFDPGDGSLTGVFGHLYNADGSSAGSEFQINTTEPSSQVDVHSATLADGSWITVWSSGDGGDGSDFCIRASINGGDDFVINDSNNPNYTAGRQHLPAVTALEGGGFVVAWVTDYADASGLTSKIQGRVFDAGGEPASSFFTISTTTFEPGFSTTPQLYPSVAALPGGGFFVTWEAFAWAGGNLATQGIHGRLYDASGSALTGDMLLKDNGIGAHEQPQAAVLADGRILVTWDFHNATSNVDIGAMILDADARGVTLTGTAADDVITGTDFGRDTLNGGDGNDVLAGLANNDTLDGGDGSDTADYSAAAAAVVINLNLTGLQPNGGGGRDTLISIENLIGTGFNDTLTGNAADNRLAGGDGNDALNGGGGRDTADYSAASGGVSVNLTIATAQNTLSAGMDTLSSIENILGSAHDDVLTGNDGRNVLMGGDGNDILFGLLGNDTLDGGIGFDTVYYSSAGSAVTVNLSRLDAQNTGGAGRDTLVSIESVVGSDFDDTLIGDDFDNALYGRNGNDTLKGGFGNDVLNGGQGNDTLMGQGGTDMADYLDATSGVTVDLLITAQQNTGGAGLDTLISIEDLQGSFFDDTLSGTNSFNFIRGRDGADTISGLGGDDQLIGEAGNDTLSGGSNNDSLYGGNDDDSLDGGSGNDLIVGGHGNDTLSGGVGSDTFVFGPGSSVFSSGGGDDIVVDFNHNVDFIDVADYGYASFSQARSHFENSGANDLLFTDGDDSILFLNVRRVNIDIDNLIWTHGGGA